MKLFQRNPKVTDAENFINNGHVKESVCIFELCPQLRVIIEKYPKGTKCYADIDDNTGAVQILPLSGEPSGYRVIVENYFIYLSLEENDPSGKWFQKHLMMMGSGFYYIPNKEILAYWEKPDDKFNKAENYANQSQTEKSIYLHNIIQKCCSGGIGSALEIGCNIGRNLYYLKNNLNIEVSGIEISGYALSLLFKTYPILQGSRFWNDNAVEIIPDIPDNYADLVFSMAVLMHLHPTTPDTFWGNVVRVAKKYIITIENEQGASGRNWLRNYQALFEKFGVRQIYSESSQVSELEHYVTRVFVKVSKQ